MTRVYKFSREFSPKHHRKGCKLSSEAKNSLENFSTLMITLLLKIVLFLTQSEWSTQRIINKTPSLNREGWGGSLVWVSCYTLMTPLTPFWIGCKACVYRGFDTLAPLKRKFSRTRAHKVMNLKPETWNLKPEMRQRATVCKVEFSKMFARTSFLNTLTEIRG